MKAEIVVKQIVVRGQQMVEMMEFKNVMTKEEIPNEYEEGELCFWKSTNEKRIMLYIPDSSRTEGYKPLIEEIYIGARLTQNRFNELYTWLVRAGERLAKINKKLKEQNKEWNKTVTYHI